MKIFLTKRIILAATIPFLALALVLSVSLAISNSRPTTAVHAAKVKEPDFSNLTWEDFDVLKPIADAYVVQNPHADEETIDNYLRAELARICASKKGGEETRGVIGDFFNKLSSEEQALSILHPFKASDVRASATKAEEMSRILYWGGFGNEDADAFRHSYWNAHMTDMIGEEWAEKLLLLMNLIQLIHWQLKWIYTTTQSDAEWV
jgi:hypothetical protein